MSVSNRNRNRRTVGREQRQEREDEWRRTAVRNVEKNSPDCSVRVINLGLDHVPEPVNVFPDVKHRQRHGASKPYR